MEGNTNNQKAWGLTTQTKLIWSYNYALHTLRNALGKQGSVKGVCTRTHTEVYLDLLLFIVAIHYRFS